MTWTIEHDENQSQYWKCSCGETSQEATPPDPCPCCGAEMWYVALTPTDWECKKCHRVYQYDQPPGRCAGCEKDAKIVQTLTLIVTNLDGQIEELTKLRDHYKYVLFIHTQQGIIENARQDIQSLILEYNKLVIPDIEVVTDLDPMQDFEWDRHVR